MRNILRSRILWIVVVAIVIVGVIFFPHTKRTKVNGELTGVYTTVEERYLLHNMVELKTTNVCTSGVVVRVMQYDYKLNGDIKTISIENCDGSKEVTEYRDGRYIVKESFLNVSGNNLRTAVIEYNDVGLQVHSESFNLGVSSVTDITYNEKNEMESSKTETRKLDELFETTETSYVDGDPIESTLLRYDYGMIILEVNTQIEDNELVYEEELEYEDGILIRRSVFNVGALETTVYYEDDLEEIVFTGNCEENVCYIDTLITADFELEFVPYGYPLEGGDYELIRLSDGLMLPIATYMFEFSTSSDIQSYVEAVVAYILEQIE